ncbi:hypothetical protein [Comamonas sp. NLF-1-9]|nr:hypothetical protein [Comamonas sp. NLF-1-9]
MSALPLASPAPRWRQRHAALARARLGPIVTAAVLALVRKGAR